MIEIIERLAVDFRGVRAGPRRQPQGRRSIASIATRASRTNKTPLKTHVAAMFPVPRPAEASGRGPVLRGRARLGLGRRRHVRARHVRSCRPCANTSPPTIAGCARSSNRRASAARSARSMASSCSACRAGFPKDHAGGRVPEVPAVPRRPRVPGRVRHQPALLSAGVAAASSGRSRRSTRFLNEPLARQSGEQSGSATAALHSGHVSLSRSTVTVAFRRPSTSRSAPTRPARPSARRSRRGWRRWPPRRIEIPLVIGGKDVRTGTTEPIGDAARSSPRARRLSQGHAASTSVQAIDAARAAHREWSRWSFDDRAAVLLKAAELLTTTWRDTINAATMLGQSKTVFQAEIDAACEIIDFWRFNVHYAPGTARRAADQRSHDVEPARVPRARGVRLRGHAVQLHVDRRQPADRAGADGQHRRLEAGVERDVLGALPDAAARGGRAAARRHQLRRRRRRDDLERAAVAPRISPACTSPAAPTSSTSMWKTIGASMAALPLLSAHRRRNRRQGLHHRAPVGRSGGARGRRSCAAASSSRDRSARPSAASTSRARSGATSAIAWSAMIDDIKMGDVQDFRNFMGAVIDKRAFEKITGLHRRARGRRDDRRRRRVRRQHAATSSARRSSKRRTRLIGCSARRSSARSSPPTSTTIDQWAETLELVDRDLAVRADRRGVRAGSAGDRRGGVGAARMRPATSTSTTSRPARSSVSSRSAARAASGTNDKAGSKLNLVRWVSARTVKENFNPPRDYRYPFMDASRVEPNRERQRQRRCSSAPD